MIFESENISLKITQEPYFTLGSSDNLRSYSREYDLDPDYRASSIYGLVSDDSNNCVILAGGGSSGVSKQSAIIHESKVWVCIGDQLVCLSLPSLEMLWHLKVDDATCFGVYLSPDGIGLIVYGELLISKITFSGEFLWCSGGKDIFTEGFEIHNEYIEAIDFNNEKYCIEIENGKSKLV